MRRVNTFVSVGVLGVLGKPYARTDPTPPSGTNAERLERLATVLEGPKSFAVTIGRRHQWNTEAGSAAEHDASLGLFAGGAEDLIHAPRSLASLHVLTAAHHLAAISALIRTGEAIGPPMALARAAYENAVMGFFVLDPRIEPRRRVARAILQDIVGACWQARADRLVGGENHPGYLNSITILERIIELAVEHFEVVLHRRIEAITVDGEKQPTFTNATREWAQWRQANLADTMTEDQAAGLYAELSQYAHPQSFISHRTARWGPDVEPGLSIDIGMLERLTLFAHGSVLDLAALLYRYHGWDYPELEANERLAFEAWPDEF